MNQQGKPVRTIWSVAFGLLLVAGLAWIWINRVPAGPAAAGSALPAAPAVGHPAPDFTLTTVDGQSFKLSALRGKPVVLNFWATWCPPCRSELPELQAASQRHAGQVVIAAVNQLEPVGDVFHFAQAEGLTFPIPLDSNGVASRAYAVRSLPTTFFVDRDGVIREMQIGPLTEATLAELLASVYP